MELTVLSGKGGTGKTTVAMALSQLAGETVMADCDVDAPNLYLFFDGEDIRKERFSAMKKAVIDTWRCTHCGRCEAVCRFGAITGGKVDVYRCEGCGACTLVCPESAAAMRDEKTADAYVTRTQNGYLTRAEMEIGSDGSGKLVTLLRENAKEVAAAGSLIITDGSPGIGCPVISSITASDIVLIVTEPTQSGFDDFVRVAALCAHFGISALACVNKYDINEGVAERIEDYCRRHDIAVVGRIPYDDTVMRSVNDLKPITDYPQSTANRAIRQMWENVKAYINK
ncbi:MAG: ATP-binding protein [Eubacteriales bacterium]|nr:ATP-binding protein [Eubacteriales bacterium]